MAAAKIFADAIRVAQPRRTEQARGKGRKEGGRWTQHRSSLRARARGILYLSSREAAQGARATAGLDSRGARAQGVGEREDGQKGRPEGWMRKALRRVRRGRLGTTIVVWARGDGAAER
ncbi:hypothetical protein K523DRAFT_120230 [Schizophyllum commune Tattone D]|nr:hypothetical protein K523DRAFT_120230 [Schizophyllum commune Tattone D]